MSIAYPLRFPYYELGVLIQQCSRCEWAQRGHILELAVCPECGQLLGTPCALEFGGLRVVYTGKGFRLSDRRGEPKNGPAPIKRLALITKKMGQPQLNG